MTRPLDAELLDRLPAAWNATGTATEQACDRLPELLPRGSVAAASVVRGEAHGDPSQWEDAHTTYRPS